MNLVLLSLILVVYETVMSKIEYLGSFKIIPWRYRVHL